jgi:signal transduction histidine kinase/ActR/RegA family two-component response regulator
MSYSQPSGALPRIYLDPDEAAREKVAKAYRFHVIQVPCLRALGLSLIALFVLLHNRYLLRASTETDFWYFLLIIGLYIPVTWLILSRWYPSVTKVNLGTVFLVLDLLMFNLAVYFSGGEKSWLFFLYMVRTADQARTTFRNALFIGHISTLSYALLLGYLAYGEQRPLVWPAEGAKLVLIYASNLYLTLIARAAEDLRDRLVAAVRVGRDLIVQLEEQSTQLAAAKNHAEQLSQELEHRVHERTAELSQANARLHAHIAERDCLAEELLKARKIESIGVLAGGIAHDFNNLLLGILGSLSLAKTMITASPPLERILTIAEQACRRATALTQQLLTFAKGGVPIRHAVAFADLLHEVVSFVLHGSNVRCDLTIPPALWPVEVDAGQISQVLNNLLINADQAMPEGGVIEVQAANVVVQSPGGLPLAPGPYVQVTITDHGCGIPEAHQEKIFDPYFTTKQGGSGLGLATSYAIMRKHAGHITVASTLGVGTTFTLYLPVSERACASIAADSAHAVQGQGRILVMDDEEMLRELVRAMLSHLGYEAVCAADGGEAIALYERAQAAGEPFTAVILDLTVPGGMGGKETCRALRARDPQVKVIVSSGYSSEHVMADFTHYGFSGVLTKPYQIHELGALLQRVVQRSAAEPS